MKDEKPQDTNTTEQPKNINKTSNSQEATKKAPKNKRGSFDNVLNSASLLNARLRSIKNNGDYNQQNNHPFANISQRINPLAYRRNQIKNNQNQDNDTTQTSNSSEEETISSKRKKKSSLAKPNFLENDEITEDVEGNEGTNFLNSIFGRKKKGGVAGTLKATAKAFLAANLPILIMGIIGIFFMLFIIMVPVMIISVFSPIFSISEKLGLDTGGEEYTSDDKDEQEFTERLAKVQDEYKEEDKEISAQVISGVYAVVHSYNDKYGYEDMTESDMRTVADMMIDTKENSDGTEQYIYDAEKFKKDLASDFLPKKIKGLSDEQYAEIAQEVYDYVDDYKSLISDENEEMNSSSSGINQCDYNLTKVNYEKGKTITANINPSNIKVRLMQSSTCGGTTGQPIAGEELVDFEKYILGVAYAEMGDGAPEQAFKAQLIVARNFSLIHSLAKQRNNLYQENGQWIMEITNCNADQYYCDPDKGCSWDAENGNRHAISGTNGPDFFKKALPYDAPERTWAAEVVGKTAVDENGYLVWTDFTDTQTQKMISLAGNLDYEYATILMEMYGDVGFYKIANANCRNISSGTYTTWKQTDEKWRDVVLGGGTDQARSLGKIGCLVTSIAILIQKSNALIIPPPPALVSASNFNPGTFAQALNSLNAFDSEGKLAYYSTVSEVVPAFHYYTAINLAGLSRNDKLNKIREMTSEYYCTAQVLPSSAGTHFVAINYVDGDNIIMIDPGAADNGTNMWTGYNWEDTDKIVCFSVH